MGGGEGGDLWTYIQVGYKSVCVQVSLLSRFIEDFNKSIHKIHNLSCITLRLVILVCWLGVYLFIFFWRKYLSSVKCDN